jgi:sugar phosphate permease
MTLIGIAVAVFGAVSWFWVRNQPQDVGLKPDNGKYPEAEHRLEGGKSKWSFKTLLRNKNAWFLSVGYGLLFLVTSAMVSQTVPYLMEQGFEQTNAVATLSLAAGIGIAGSFIWGVLDDSYGTKFTSIIYCIWYIVTFMLLFMPYNNAMIMVGIVMLGASLGGIGNLMPSMIITTFGPAEFPSVNRVVNTVCALVRAFSFLAMALGLQINGTYRFVALPLAVITAIALILILGIDKKDAPQNYIANLAGSAASKTKTS